jgi:hypothetical protein
MSVAIGAGWTIGPGWSLGSGDGITSTTLTPF